MFRLIGSKQINVATNYLINYLGMKSKIEEFISNWSDGNICDWEITSLEKYYSFLKDKSEAFQHLWMSLIIVQYLSLLHFIAHKDQNYYVKAFSLLQKAILPMLEHYGNESLGKMLTLLLIDFSKYVLEH